MGRGIDQVKTPGISRPEELPQVGEKPASVLPLQGPSGLN
jgi:hypothetical protein